MAPILKDGENSAEPPSPAAPAPTAPKAAADGSTRTQPVALEIPVTVNGARTIDGSDKREPFSETTKTVLVFNHGAVIRIATPVAAGQLVFLTNEKSRKEVVCQVVKSKSGGGPGSGYVELQFTEPSAGFWGMRFPAPSAIPAAPAVTAPAPPRPVTPVALGPSATVATSTPQVTPVASASSAVPAAPKAISPALPVVPKVAPVLSTPPLPPNPAVVPPPRPVVAPEPPKPLALAATTPSPTPVSFVPLPAPLPPLAPPPSLEAKGGPGIPEIHDYSKEIAAIFAMPPVGSVQAPPAGSASPASPRLSAEDLKRQAATPASPASPSAAPSSMSFAAHKVGSAPSESAQKTAGVTHQETRPATKPLPKPPSTAPRSVSYDIDQVEEVKVPDWLAPLSRNAEPSPAATPAPVPVEQHRVPGWLAPLSHIAQPAPTPPPPSATVPAEVTPISFSSVEPPASEPSPGLEAEVSSDDAAFGGSMFDESSESAPEAATAGSSKKGLFLGLAAAALLVVGGGVWYVRQAHGGNNRSTAKAVQAPVSSQTVAANNLSGAKPEAAAPLPSSNPSSATPSPASGQPAKNSPSSVVSSAPPTTPKNAAPPRNEAPVEQPQPKKPSLGQVHLAAPVVNRGANSSLVEADPSLAASVPTPGSAESLSALSSGHGKEPTAPLPVGGDVKPAHLVKSVPPLYPQMARTQRISGNVSIDAVVDVDGNVGTMKVLSGPAILHRAALDAVKEWRYEPAMLDGKPTASHLTVIVQFRLQ
jgi:periplasmic protein TonB